MAQKQILPPNIRVDRNCQPTWVTQNAIPEEQELILLGGGHDSPPPTDTGLSYTNKRYMMVLYRWCVGCIVSRAQHVYHLKDGTLLSREKFYMIHCYWSNKLITGLHSGQTRDCVVSESEQHILKLGIIFMKINIL